MNLRCLGGAGEVTGSAHLMITKSSRVLRDCGMFQGKRFEAQGKNRSMFKRAEAVQSVVLSHAHIDHCGNFPTMVRQGYEGPIYATPATADIAPLMWSDAAHIQEYDTKFMKKRGIPVPDDLQPLYDIDDAGRSEAFLRKHGYRRPLEVADGVSVEFYEAGHILGSALTRFTVTESAFSKKTIGFAFDLGRRGMPILKDPEFMEGLDTLVIESTYGARVHEDLSGLEERLLGVLTKTFDRGGKVIIPAFALGRTQEVLYSVKRLIKSGRCPNVPVYVDSPLATRVSEVFLKHTELFDQETVIEGSSFLEDGFVTYTLSKEDSQALNDLRKPCIIIAASGMCESGRILHHLIHNVGDEKNTILIVGFMAANTNGRRLLEMADRPAGDPLRTIKIYDGWYKVSAEIQKLNAFSAHADRNDLLEYIRRCGKLKNLVLVHGEETQIAALAEGAKGVTSAKIMIPKFNEEIEL